ncbi:MAG: neutral/alkaline non-lysosomal ceramidase N-terminal domain-containing protein [Candidatus Poribacteria bacterium]|nr:neutral/alkaline non-lysosomal ceramidase N-terminal domain-containing protein [Candidatus Poribacteria bacterium]
MSETASLRAGIAVTDITPPIGVDMTGYGGRPTGCTSIHDPIFARALVLQNDAKTLALVSFDTIGIDFDLRDEIRARVTEQTGIAPECLLLNASHTHAGPATETFRGLGELDAGYVASFVDRIVATVRKAATSLVPARIGRTRVPAQIGMNRRQSVGGAIHLGFNEKGVVVPHADVLRIDTADGELLATWFAHACHPTTVGGDNLAISAEWCGVAVNAVEAVCGGTAMFAQGCCGDINPKPRGTYDNLIRAGKKLGGAVIAGVEDIFTIEDAPVLDARMEVLPLAVQPPPPLEEAERELAAFTEQVEQAKREGLHRGHVWLREAARDWMAALRDYALKPDETPTTIGFEVQALRIGDFAVVGLPGEVFAEIGNAIDDASPFAQTSVLGYTNGCHGYVPTESAYALGGYEVDNAIRYYGTLMFAPESDGQLRAGAGRILQQLFDGA